MWSDSGIDIMKIIFIDKAMVLFNLIIFYIKNIKIWYLDIRKQWILINLCKANKS